MIYVNAKDPNASVKIGDMNDWFIFNGPKECSSKKLYQFYLNYEMNESH